MAWCITKNQVRIVHSLFANLLFTWLQVYGVQYGLHIRDVGIDWTQKRRYFLWRIPRPTTILRCSDGSRSVCDRTSWVSIIALPCSFESISLNDNESPYINAEVTGGGFPGWGTYTPGLWRTSNETFVEAYQGYVRAVGNLIAKNQIDQGTRFSPLHDTWDSSNPSGGPVILVQAENEYSGFQAPYTEDFAYQERLLQDFVRCSMKLHYQTLTDMFFNSAMLASLSQSLRTMYIQVEEWRPWIYTVGSFVLRVGATTNCDIRIRQLP